MNRLAISFSGGRSSAVMLKLCLDKYSSTHDIKITFANTGCEHEETLKFVDAADRNWCRPAGYEVEWIESVMNEPGVGPSAKRVDFQSASRNGEPFRAAIEKHGVFSKSHPQCTSRLKEEPLLWWRRQCGWSPHSYDVAIGIRADEADRMSEKRKQKRFIYPLVEAGWKKSDVNQFMAQFEWDLKLPSDAWGNCVWCWKKSLRKLMTVAKNDPAAFDFPGEMERRHGWVNRGSQEQKDPRVFFRENRSAQDIVVMAHTQKFKEYQDSQEVQATLFGPLDIGGGCGDSCEIG